MVNKYLKLAGFWLALGFAGLQVNATSHTSIGEIPHTTEKVMLDGVLDESIWKSALLVELNVETEPADNLPATFQTSAFLLEDGQNLYVGFRAFDPNPESIRSFMADRDNIWNSDLVSIKLDTFNDQRKAFQFFASPIGLQADLVLDDSNVSTDISWDAIWFSRGQITDFGFEVEMQIPFDAIRFDDSEGTKTWGVELVRTVKKEVSYRLSSQARPRGQECNVCNLNTVSGLKKVEPSQRLILTPSIVVTDHESRDLEAASDWQSDDQTRTSFDIRWGISENSLLNATINPDFSQVEADAFQLDVNTLSVLSLEEKRPFFQDGSDYFSNWSQLVYTRIFQEPEAGLKLTSRFDSHALGVMAIKDKHTNFLVPYSQGAYLVSQDDHESDNFIARYRYDVGEKSNIGMIVTIRSGDDYHNQVIGTDGKYWLSSQDYIRYQAFWSETENPEQVVIEFEGELNGDRPMVEKEMSGNAYALNYTHNSEFWRWYATIHRFDQGFRADAGFINVSNWERERYGLSRSWYSNDQDSWWKKFSALVTRYDTREVNGADLHQETNLNFEVSGIYESTLGLDNRQKKEFYNGQWFSRDGNILWGNLHPHPSVLFEYEYEVADAIYYSQALQGSTKTLQLKTDIQLIAGLSSSIEMITQDFELPEQELYQLQLVNLQIAYQFNERNLFRLTFQGRDLDYATSSRKSTGIQILYAYKLNPLTLFYLGYSDAARNSLTHTDPDLIEKTLFTKFSYAWQL